MIYILRAATLVILSVSFAAHIYGESVGESTKPSNGLIAFADAPGQRPGPQATQYAQIHTITPDGKRILFDTQRRKRPEIWVMNADGSDQHVLVSNLRVIPIYVIEKGY